MSAQDASFLRLENERCHMQIAALAIFEGPAPPQAEIQRLIHAKLDQVPRFRQSVRFVPLELGHPLWVDEADFDLDYHLRRTAIPQPGSMAELQTLVGRLMSLKLDRSKPLWEMWVIEGIAEGRWALLSKTHHCLTDGGSGSLLLSTILEASPDSEPEHGAKWVPRRVPSSLELAAHAVGSGIRAPRDGLRSAASALATPRRAIHELGEFVDGLRSFRPLSEGVPATALNGPVGPHRRWCSARSNLADVKKIGSRFGATVNDVVLSAVARGFRELLLSRGEQVEGRSVRSLVPVSIRRAADRGQLNNRVAAMIIDLPLDTPGPVECLEAVRTEMARLKEHHQSDATAALLALSSYSPPALLSLGGRLLGEIDHHAIQTVTTNVVGPPRPLFALGRRMLAVYPYVPLAASVRIGVAIASYAGELGFGVTGDYESAADIDRLAVSIERELADLLRSV